MLKLNVANFYIQDSSASYDFAHYDSDPTPDYSSDEPNRHGTSCAGEVGMARNSLCGVGVAHECKIGGTSFLISSLPSLPLLCPSMSVSPTLCCCSLLFCLTYSCRTETRSWSCNRCNRSKCSWLQRLSH